jgi:hypothetical protein
VTGTSPDLATTVLTSEALPAGKYAFNGQIVLHGASTDATVSCQAHGPGPTGPRLGDPSTMRVGQGAGAVRDGTIPLDFAATLATSDSVYVGCWVDSVGSTHPTASAHLVAVTILNLTQSSS